MTWLSDCIVSQGILSVQTRNTTRESPHWYNFTVLRRNHVGRWESTNTTSVRARDFVVTGSTWLFSNSYRGFLLGNINNSGVQVRNYTLNSVEGHWEAVINYQTYFTLQQFGREIYQRRQSEGLQLAANLSIAVAIVSGIALGAGFGPAAGALGVAGATTEATTITFFGITGAVNVEALIVAIISAAVARFIKENHDAMFRAVRDDPANGAAHFYRANSTNFKNILINTVISGVSNGITALIPSPPGGCSSLRLWGQTVADRMANAFAGIVQGIVEQIATGDWRRRSANQIRDDLVVGLIRDLVIRIFR